MKCHSKSIRFFNKSGDMQICQHPPLDKLACLLRHHFSTACSPLWVNPNEAAGSFWYEKNYHDFILLGIKKGNDCFTVFFLDGWMILQTTKNVLSLFQMSVFLHHTHVQDVTNTEACMHLSVFTVK